MERNYPDFHCRVNTTCDVQRAALKVIFGHVYKGEQESIIFGLNLKQQLPAADGASFIATVTASGATKQDAASHPSRAEKTLEKYTSGPSIGKAKRSNCFGCGSDKYLTVKCETKGDPVVAAKIAAAVEALRERNRLRDRKRERNRRGIPHFEDFKDAHQKILHTQVLATVVKERKEEEENEERRRKDEQRHCDSRRDDDCGEDGYCYGRYYLRDDDRACRPNNAQRDLIMGQAVMTLATRGSPTTKCVLFAVATAIGLLTAIVTTVATFAVVSCTSHASHLFPCLDQI